MRRLALGALRAVLLAGLCAAGAVQYRSAHAARPSVQPTAVLVWQGKILPIVTDVYDSFDNLNTAIQDRSIEEVAGVSGEFAGELQRLDAIRPTPKETTAVKVLFDKGLQQMQDGTKRLVTGLRASDQSGTQSAANLIVAGFGEFRKAVAQVHGMSAGPASSATVGVGSGPTPTPVIRGLP